VPAGGTIPVFGTNPIAFGIPRKKEPFIFDMSTSAVTHGDVVLAARLNNALPEGVAVDAAGLPTNDPNEALKGGILPFGGHKGHGLAFTIQALCLLAGPNLYGRNIHDFAFLFLVFDPALLMPREEFERDLDNLISEVSEIPAAKPGERIRLPSQRAFAERERRRREGITLPSAIYSRLSAL